MANIDLLKISYDRVVGTEDVTLTKDNYKDYGYSIDDDGNFYIYDSDQDKNIYATYVTVDVKKTFEHILPCPSSFDISYQDVDADGSGRSASTGLMARSRIGHYQSIEVTFDVVEGSTEGRNLVRVLKNLPPSFNLTYHDIEDLESDTKTGTYYRGDLNYGLYMFLANNQIWKGLSTSFIQYDVTPYDDDVEPDLL